MPWFKVDDQFAFNAKVMAAGNEAVGLWVRAGSWSAAQLTDGFIPDHMANAMANGMAKECGVDALVNAGLWNRIDGGYRFHDWDEFQPSAEDEKKKRKARSDAGKAGARARWDGKPHGKPHADAMAKECEVDDPTRPDPTRPTLSKESVPTSGNRRPNVALPVSWAPTSAHKEYTEVEGIRLDFEADRFRAHAEANDRRLRDWDAGFRNWLLKAERTTKKQIPHNPLWDS
ncbi:hypothetical protein [Arthrobacter roseus]|uniref:hypothetical protein n=1 Tax=Arthrobacter roseus TaxID=136274 RepID=UPI001962D257|nr:hypothetical protein [Arthrobacter roseus]MBM7847483.1 hypothetical protein [Arthrobacter roseus]